MPFGVIDRTGPGMTQVVRFAHRSTGRGTFGAHLGRVIVSNKDLRRACATVPQPSGLRFGVVRAVGRGIAVLDGGLRSPTGRGILGVFVRHFHNGKCH